MSDLCVTTHTPTLRSGRALRTYAVVRALAAHGPVDLLYVAFGAPAPAPEYARIDGLTLHELRPSRGLRRALAYARARAWAPPAFARAVSAELVAAARELARAPGRGRTIADGAAAAVAVAQSGAPFVYNAHNLESSFRHAAGERGFGSPARLRAFERRLLARADETWMASPADVDGGRDLAPGAVLRCVPNAIDVRAIDPAPPPPARCRALFVADFTYAPNVRGLRFLIDDVMPRVWERLPDARLTLVGRGLDAPPSADARVAALGFVDDLAAAYAATDCVVVPLLEGGGSPLKFIEALAYGRPVVATPAAARGLEARAGEHHLEAADGPAFAAALSELLRGGGGELAARGRALAERRYSIEALVAAVAP